MCRSTIHSKLRIRFCPVDILISEIGKIKKNKKIRTKKEKILLSYSAIRRDQDKLKKIKLSTVKYESSPLKIAVLCFVIYLLFNYIYFKL